MRVIAPLGVLCVKEEGEWTKIVKPWPKEIDEWTHFLHNPQNNAVCSDALVGQPRSLRWTAGPRWSRSHEEMASMSAMVSARGRIFYIIDDGPLMSLRFPSTWKVIGLPFTSFFVTIVSRSLRNLAGRDTMLVVCRALSRPCPLAVDGCRGALISNALVRACLNW